MANEKLGPGAGASARTRIRRHPERSTPELAEELLRAGRVAHVAFVAAGQPYVLPFTYHYDAGKLYIHGAPASRTLRTLQPGTPVCAEVTLLDGLVASRDAKSHSVNYRSVVIFGEALEVTDLVEKRLAFEVMTRRYFPGRAAGREYAPARDGDLRAVTLLAIAIEELSAKARSGPALGPRDGDEAAAGTSFVLLLPELDA
jgi:nitroimidazol reductase NimA-like FMN-containing flavoprotein (pyridoxamine 5'-phosphate oxidase superfamily)